MDIGAALVRLSVVCRGYPAEVYIAPLIRHMHFREAAMPAADQHWNAPVMTLLVQDGETALHTPVYSLLPVDLHCVLPLHVGLTVLLDPVVLTLLAPAACALLAWFTAHVDGTLEMYRLGDAVRQ
ncbi:hypothetical protein BC834DRAFT_967473 [Gloeopeniophorella convolvens]|nr:hypothetical protein BC834DRAFT_967473 [Gloeopeniophorella convolvens]